MKFAGHDTNRLNDYILCEIETGIKGPGNKRKFESTSIGFAAKPKPNKC